MDLLAILKKEMGDLGITDSYEIAYYIYVRTGQIFEFNIKIGYCDKDTLLEILKEKFDIRNIRKRKIICFKWAPLYVALLKEFGIEAKEGGDDRHAYVLFCISEKWYKADITVWHEDISRAKFGLPMKHIKGDTNLNDLDKKFGFFKGMAVDEVIGMVKEEILKEDLRLEEMYERVLQFLGMFFEFNRENVGYKSGEVFISYVIYEILKTELYYDVFYDLDRDDYFSVYYLSSGECFIFKKDEDDFYRFRRGTMEDVERLQVGYCTKRAPYYNANRVYKK